VEDFDIPQNKLIAVSDRDGTRVVEDVLSRESVAPADAIVPALAPSRRRLVAPARRMGFVVIPFAIESLNVVYEDFVRPALTKRCKLAVERGDDVFGSNVIMDDIVARIAQADVVIADLTGRNANVCYEAGIAHAMQKQVLLMAQSLDDVPFDLRHRRVLLYQYSPRGCKKLERELADHVHAMLQIAK